MDRRYFLKSSGLAMLGWGFAPGFLTRALAQSPASKKILVVIFQRGGCDGLSVIPPFGDPHYAGHRPNIAIPPPGKEGGAIPLDDTFGFHPALSSLQPLYESGVLAVIQAAGQTRPTRSHFDAQDFMESGTPGTRGQDGWLNRALANEPRPDAGTFRAVALQPNLPRSLFGNAPAIAMSSLGEFKLQAGVKTPAAMTSFEAMYASAVDTALRSTGAEAFDALKKIGDPKIAQMPPENGAEYPKAALGRRLQDIARLIRAEVGLEIAATDMGGWDTHIGQGAAQGQLANRLKELGDSLAAFAQDLGPRMADICVVTMTEFGRTVRENGNRGTDHGTASVMMVLGGGVRGKRVYADWKGLAPGNLFEGRDLAVTTDYRTVLAEVLAKHLGVTEGIFPDFSPPAPLRLWG